jgi:hypothetical protein
MTTSRRFPIVGSRFRPPAEAIIEALPVGQPLILRPEPENPHDPRAKAIWVRTALLTETARHYLSQRTDLRLINQEAEWHLGYIPANMNAFDLPSEIEGEFSVGSDGGPRITIQDPSGA